MPFKEATFWFGTLLFANGLYFWTEGGNHMTAGIVLTLIGFVMAVYAVIAHHYPDNFPKLPLWVVAFALSWVALGYDIYDRHHSASGWTALWFIGIAACAVTVVIWALIQFPSAPKEPSKLVIHSAVYGVGDATDIVLTEKLNEITKEGLVVPVNKNLVDHDPAPNKPKRLKVTYKYDAGDPHTVVLPEDSWLMLPENPQLLKLKSEIEALQKHSTQDAPLSDLQSETLQLSRDLRLMLKDAGPQPAPTFEGPLKEGQDQKAWMDQQLVDTSIWQNAYSEWARKIIYRYREEFAGRVKKLVNSLGRTTGMVVAPLEPYATDVRPGDDFNNLIDLLMGFFVKLENPKPYPIVSREMLNQSPVVARASPRIVVEVRSETDRWNHPIDEIVYRNDGDATAFKVELLPFMVGESSVSLYAVPNIAAGRSSDKLYPRIESNNNVFARHDLAGRMMKEWKEIMAEQVVFPASAEYTNFDGSVIYTVKWDFVLYPFEKWMRGRRQEQATFADDTRRPHLEATNFQYSERKKP